MIVGFIEPVGTSFQSANEERIENTTNPSRRNDRSSAHHERRALEPRDREFMAI
jgi:hypothetical protein